MVLRHGLGDRQLPDVVRLRPRRRAARLAAVEAGQPPHRYADQLHLALRDALHAAGAAVAVEHHRLRWRPPRSRSSASTSPTWPGVPAPAQRRTSSPGRGTSGKWSAPVGWIAIVWVVVICVLFVLPTAGPITATQLQLHDRRRGRRGRRGHDLVVRSAPGSGSPGPKQNLIEKAAHGEPTLPHRVIHWTAGPGAGPGPPLFVGPHAIGLLHGSSRTSDVAVDNGSIDTVLLAADRHAGPAAGQTAARPLLHGRGGRAAAARAATTCSPSTST